MVPNRGAARDAAALGHTDRWFRFTTKKVLRWNPLATMIPKCQAGAGRFFQGQNHEL
jgi:hypothetical protein